MTPFFNIIQPALWKVTRNLMRDYRELENMQLGNCLSVDRFSLMSCQRVRDVIQQEVSLSSYKSMIFNSTKLPEEEGLYLLVQDLEGVQNFKKSLPFFATSVVCIEHTNKLTQAIAAYITLPAIGYGFYAEAGQGAWAEKYDSSQEIGKGGRLRTSGLQNPEKALVNQALKLFNPSFEEARDFGSYSYDLSLFMMGKLDGILIPSNYLSLKYTLELFACESGASFSINTNKDAIALSQGIGLKYSKH